jgi:hypothetical protein
MVYPGTVVSYVHVPHRRCLLFTSQYCLVYNRNTVDFLTIIVCSLPSHYILDVIVCCFFTLAPLSVVHLNIILYGRLFTQQKCLSIHMVQYMVWAGLAPH